MRYGICIGDDVAKISVAKAIGYDYVESSFSLLANEETEKFNSFGRELARVGIGCESVNCFLPSQLPVIGPNVDYDSLTSYVERGMRHGKELGVKVVVFGSSGARKIPEGWTYKEAVGQILRFLTEVAGPLAAQNGIIVTIEPLRLAECNFINRVREGAAIASAAGLDSVRSLADLFHMVQIGDTDEDVLAVGDVLRHAHIAEPSRRVYPADPAEYDYGSFIRALEAVGCPRCSLEAGVSDFEREGRIACELFKSL